MILQNYTISKNPKRGITILHDGKHLKTMSKRIEKKLNKASAKTIVVLEEDKKRLSGKEIAESILFNDKLMLIAAYPHKREEILESKIEKLVLVKRRAINNNPYLSEQELKESPFTTKRKVVFDNGLSIYTEVESLKKLSKFTGIEITEEKI